MALHDAMARYIKSRWGAFWYNFKWENYVSLLDGWVAKGALAIPLVGYLVIFNDTIAYHLNSFELLTGSHPVWKLVDGSTRIKMLYLGLVALAVANALYIWRRPYIMRLGDSQEAFIRNAMGSFTVGDFVRINSTIQSRSRYTQQGKYYTGEWETFLSIADGERGSRARSENFSGVDFEGAKARFGSLLRGMLAEFYFGEMVQRRGWLVACLAFASLGYVLLAVPAADLFVRVLSVIIQAF